MNDKTRLYKLSSITKRSARERTSYLMVECQAEKAGAWSGWWCRTTKGSGTSKSHSRWSSQSMNIEIFFIFLQCEKIEWYEYGRMTVQINQTPFTGCSIIAFMHVHHSYTQPTMTGRIRWSWPVISKIITETETEWVTEAENAAAPKFI